MFVSGRDVRGKLREWVSTEQHGPVDRRSRRNHVVTSVRANPRQKPSSDRGRTDDFCGLTNLLLPKKREKNKKKKNKEKKNRLLDQLGDEREGSALGHAPSISQSREGFHQAPLLTLAASVLVRLCGKDTCVCDSVVCSLVLCDHV